MSESYDIAVIGAGMAGASLAAELAPHARILLAEAEERTLEYIKRFVPLERKAPLAGNTIGTDRMFLAKYMPQIDQYLHYRNVDVSSVKELSRRWYPRAYYNAPPKHGGHRALADIKESIDELRYYRATVMVPAPGPDTDTARAAARGLGLEAPAPAEQREPVSD